MKEDKKRQHFPVIFERHRILHAMLCFILPLSHSRVCEENFMHPHTHTQDEGNARHWHIILVAYHIDANWCSPPLPHPTSMLRYITHITSYMNIIWCKYYLCTWSNKPNATYVSCVLYKSIYEEGNLYDVLSYMRWLCDAKFISLKVFVNNPSESAFQILT